MAPFVGKLAWLAIATTAATAANSHPFRSKLADENAQYSSFNTENNQKQTEKVISLISSRTNSRGLDPDGQGTKKPAPEIVTNKCLKALNALRTEVGTVVPPLKALDADEDGLEKAAADAIVKTTPTQLKDKQGGSSAETSCVSAEKVETEQEYAGMIISLNKVPEGSPAGAEDASGDLRVKGQKAVAATEILSQADCEKYIRDTYQKGLAALKAHKDFDPETVEYNPTTAPFTSTDSRNLANIMWAKSLTVGCAVSKDCQAKETDPVKLGGASASTPYVLYCKFEKPLAEGDKPFSRSLYNAMLGIKEPPQPSAAAVHTPEILIFISFLAAALIL